MNNHTAEPPTMAEIMRDTELPPSKLAGRLEYWQTIKPDTVLQTPTVHIQEVAAYARADIECAEQIIRECRRVLAGIGEGL